MIIYIPVPVIRVSFGAIEGPAKGSPVPSLHQGSAPHQRQSWKPSELLSRAKPQSSKG